MILQRCKMDEITFQIKCWHLITDFFGCIRRSGFDRMVALRGGQITDVTLEEALAVPRRVDLNEDAVITAAAWEFRLAMNKPDCIIKDMLNIKSEANFI